jgi:excisionase family DNA binding protein
VVSSGKQMKLMTVKELSDFLRVKPKTLYQWTESKKIPFLKLNGALRFDLDEIQQWMASCKSTPSGAYNEIAQTASVGSPRKVVRN